MRHFRKPKSMVTGDIFPHLLTRHSDFLAIPLCSIYNSISSTYIWPRQWKIEYVTVILKVRLPQDLGDLRNISCTKLASKIYESYVLDWAKTEVTTKSNQYGGVKGCSTAHLLVKVWDKIMRNLRSSLRLTTPRRLIGFLSNIA